MPDPLERYRDPRSQCAVAYEANDYSIQEQNFSVYSNGELVLKIEDGQIEFNQEIKLEELTYKFQEICNQKYNELKRERDVARNDLNCLREMFKDFYNGKLNVEDVSITLKMQKEMVRKCFTELKKVELKRYKYIQNSNEE